MITVYGFLDEYCKEKKFDFPPQGDLKKIAKAVSVLFREGRTKIRIEEDGPITDTGLVRETQPFGTFISTGYPDSYKDEIRKVVEKYLGLLQPGGETAVKPPRKRRRIPLNKKK